LALKPDYADAHNNLGIALAAQGRTAEAIARYERALELKPEHANAHNNLGIALTTQGRIAEAIVHYRRAIQLNPRHADAHNNLGIALAELDRIGEAIACYRRALSIQPGHADACNNLGNACKAEGKFDDARAHYARAVVLRPDHAEAHYNLSEIKTYHRGDAELAALEALAVRQGLSPGKTAYVHFALAKALEDAGDYVRAFEHLRQGNALWRSLIHYDEAATLALFRRISSIFDGSLLDRFRGAGDPSPVPVFVLGMPRSGSTLVEQILASHPQIHAAGERKHLEQLTAVLRAGDPPVPYPECVPGLDSGALRRIAWDYLATLPAPANGAIRMVDKLPGNFLNIGLIRLILPNARIIHTTRDPIDTCVSCYSKLFTSGLAFSFDLAELGRYYRGYRALMRHWRSVLPPGAMLEVSYERVVEDLETEARRMIEFCGLAWNDRCVAFHETSRIVRTASSAQVRQPLYRGSLQRSRKFEAGLVPLLRALEA